MLLVMKLREKIHEKGVKGCGKEKKKQNIEFFPENICWNEIKAVTLHPLKRQWSLRLSVRTRDFHSLKRSSTLLGTTKNKKEYNLRWQITNHH